MKYIYSQPRINILRRLSEPLNKEKAKVLIEQGIPAEDIVFVAIYLYLYGFPLGKWSKWDLEVCEAFERDPVKTSFSIQQAQDNFNIIIQVLCSRDPLLSLDNQNEILFRAVKSVITDSNTVWYSYITYPRIKNLIEPYCDVDVMSIKNVLPITALPKVLIDIITGYFTSFDEIAKTMLSAEGMLTKLTDFSKPLTGWSYDPEYGEKEEESYPAKHDAAVPCAGDDELWDTAGCIIL